MLQLRKLIRLQRGWEALYLKRRERLISLPLATAVPWLEAAWSRLLDRFRWALMDAVYTQNFQVFVGLIRRGNDEKLLQDCKIVIVASKRPC